MFQQFKVYCGFSEFHNSEDFRNMNKPTPSHVSVCEKSIKLRKTKFGRIRASQNSRNESSKEISELIEINLFSLTTIFVILRDVRNLDFAEIGPESEKKKNENKKANAKVFEVAGQT